MNRRNLFKFLGALPLLAVAPKAVGSPSALNDAVRAGMFANFPGAKYEELGWYVGPNQVAKYRWVDVEQPEEWIKAHPDLAKHYSIIVGDTAYE